jgi:photosystem II stability/assembly factor-like uncharacterized protein
MKNSRFFDKLWFVLVLLLPLGVYAQKLDMDKFKNLKPRSIGPAGMSGRVTALDAIHQNPDIIYAGTASGGLWKSESGGIHWTPIFDDQKVASIGALAIDQNNPSVIWVGTGEGNPRNSHTSGNGVYKSLNGGKTWIHVGLEKTRNIHRIIIHPSNSQVVYVAAVGSAWGDSQDRGVFKTVDGGKTWEKILYVNEKTGAADMVIDPTNPDKLLVAMWEHRRQPWTFKSGGKGSGLHVTFDGGKTWEQRTSKDGLPEGELGRIGLAIARSMPNRIYAMVESKKNALYRSDDGGFKWTKVTDRGAGVGERPFYYSEIYVDPQNENRIYNLYSMISMSEDAGKTFKEIVSWTGKTTDLHPDHHAWYINPYNPNFIINGNDGGLNISRDRAKTWQFVGILPLGQFYHVNYDMEVPYNVYGGLQDNGAWRGPAYVWRRGGIRNEYWEELSFGDGFDVVPNMLNNRYGYSMWQGGNLLRYDYITGHTQYIKPNHPQGVELRFNWNAGIAIDPVDKKTVYYGSQFLHKTTDEGVTWEIISPDLTTNDTTKQKQLESGGLTYDVTAAENHTTIIAIAPSPIKQGVIWVGTDDGNLQLTKDGGKTWTNLIDKLKDVPKNSWIPQVHASNHAEGEAFVVINNYRRDDWTPYVYHTKDFGQTWRRIADDKQVWGYALSFVQDPIEPNLYFLGTEFGLYISIDGGNNWNQWKNGYPTVSTYDLKIHPREHDLIIGTFGRAIYVFDDIRPFRQLAKESSALLEKPLVVFPAPDAYLATFRQPAGLRFGGHTEYAGENRSFGAMITFYLKEFIKKGEDKKDATANTTITPAKEDKKGSKGKTETTTVAATTTPTNANMPESDTVKVEVIDMSGAVIRTMKVGAKVGMNRFNWFLDQKGVRFPDQAKPSKDEAEPSGFSVLPGTYTVRITYGDNKSETKVNVLADPRMSIDVETLKARQTTLKKLEAQIEIATKAVDLLRDAQKTIGTVNALIGDREDEAAKDAKKKGGELQKAITSQIELFNPKEEVQGIFRSANIVGEKYEYASFYLQSSYKPIGANEEVSMKLAEEKLKEAISKVNAWAEGDWKKYQEMIEALKLTPFKTIEKLEVK